MAIPTMRYRGSQGRLSTGGMPRKTTMQRTPKEKSSSSTQGFMHKDYKKDEAIMRRIVSSNVAARDPDCEIDLIIYYKNKRTSQLLMKNFPQVDEDPLKKHGVVYRIICPANGCTHSYIGMTTTKLSKRLSVHLQEGNFNQHYTKTHGELLKPTLLQATSIIDRNSDRRRLHLKEALHILWLKPSLNVTQETFLLPTNIHRNRSAAERIPAAEGTIIRDPESERAPAVISTNQRPGRRKDAASQNVLDLPAAPVRRSARIHQLAATQ